MLKTGNIFILLLSFLTSVSTNSVDSTKIYFYYGPTYDDHESYSLRKLVFLLDHPKFIHNTTNCYMHGYNNDQNDVSIRVLVNAYLKNNSTNFLTIDWAELANKRLDEDSLSFVGHSLGGLGIGIIAREIYNKSNGNVLISRITPLDPSNPDIHEVFIVPPIEKKDAKFVDVIHTSAGKRGTTAQTGQADFWPNGGIPIQPGCPTSESNEMCSHHMAWAYWAQSVENSKSNKFLSYRAESYNDFLKQRHYYNSSSNNSVLMGFDCPSSAQGNYFLEISSTDYYKET